MQMTETSCAQTCFFVTSKWWNSCGWITLGDQVFPQSHKSPITLLTTAIINTPREVRGFGIEKLRAEHSVDTASSWHKQTELVGISITHVGDCKRYTAHGCGMGLSIARTWNSVLAGSQGKNWNIAVLGSQTDRVLFRRQQNRPMFIAIIGTQRANERCNRKLKGELFKALLRHTTSLCTYIHLQSFIIQYIRAVTDSVDNKDTEDHYSLHDMSVYWCLQCWVCWGTKKEPQIWNTVSKWMQLCGSDEQEVVCFECFHCSLMSSSAIQKLLQKEAIFSTRIKASFMTHSTPDLSHFWLFQHVQLPHWQGYTEPEAKTPHKRQRCYRDLRCE